MKASPMNTITEASTGALAKGRTTRRSMRIPPMNEAMTVAAKAPQYGQPESISFQAK